MPRPHEVPPRVPHLAVAISGASRPRHLPFRGSSNPSLPIGMWEADAEVTGDASGGDMGVSCVLTEAGQVDDDYYSLESMEFQVDQDTAINVTSHVANMRNLANPAAPRTMAIALGVASGIGGRFGPRGSEFSFLPWFFGQGPAVGTGLQLFVKIATVNTLNLAMRGRFWGYRWGARAMDTPTGPVRPPGSVFGT